MQPKTHCTLKQVLTEIFLNMKCILLYNFQNLWKTNNTDIYFKGKIDNKPEKQQGKRVVTQLAKPYFGSGRRITFDLFFTSVPLAEDLFSHGLTSIRTLRANKKEIPAKFLPSKKHPPETFLQGFYKQLMLASWTVVHYRNSKGNY